MIRRLAALTALTALLVAAAVGTASPAQAEPPASVSTANGYIFCLALDVVNIGTCIEDPLRPVADLLP